MFPAIPSRISTLKPLPLMIGLIASYPTPSEAECSAAPFSISFQPIDCTEGFRVITKGLDGRDGDPGGSGQDALPITFDARETVTSQSIDNKEAFSLISIGGNGGDGSIDNNETESARGGPGGDGGTVTANLRRTVTLTTIADNASGLLVLSQGGDGGRGVGGSFSGQGRSGGAAGNGNTVNVNGVDMFIRTFGIDSVGILLQSIGRQGGRGGGGGAFAGGGTGAGGGMGGSVTGNFEGTSIFTRGNGSSAVLLQSIGGGGGSGGTSEGIVGIGGNGGQGGSSSLVDLRYQGGASTVGTDAPVFLLQSVAGGGGNAGSGTGVVGVGGAGAPGGSGGPVIATIQSLVSSLGAFSQGILIQSIGGGGGNGGSGSGIGAIGGSGAVASDGGTVNLTYKGLLDTRGDFSRGIEIMSVGGGGGTGGNGNSFGPIAVSIGGRGDGGGKADSVVAVLAADSTVSTFGKSATGFQATSIGGGGGSGGGAFAAALSGDSLPGAAVALGGIAGAGGAGGSVQVTTDSTSAISTSGDDSAGLVAQSVGGGGGVGGTTVSSAISFAKIGTAVALGGSGGNGGDGLGVTVAHGGSISTGGAVATGLLAQSVGGGGGRGGSSTALVASFGLTSGVSLGGSGGDGGHGGSVVFRQTGQIQTTGDASRGVVVQSIGGGGGDGGFAFSGSLGFGFPFQPPSVASSLSLGGSGGGGGFGSGVDVLLDASSVVSTSGLQSTGLLAQSVGGGGGSGGGAASLVLGFNSRVTANTAIGAAGGNGGSGGSVTAVTKGLIETEGNESSGIVAQSVGGGGGSGGQSYSLSFNTNLIPNMDERVNLGLSLGGSGANGGIGSNVVLKQTGMIVTQGHFSHGAFAQSLGGGGGYGGNALGLLTELAARTTRTVSANVSIGGSGGVGNDAGQVNLSNEGLIITNGDFSHSLIGQSIGGGGGDGGAGDQLVASISPDLLGDVNLLLRGGIKSASVAVGGSAGTGGQGGDVVISNSGSLFTAGFKARAILAQSVGGGGGIGGSSTRFSLDNANIRLKSDILTDRVGLTDLSLQVGGAGGASGNGGTVFVRHSSGFIQTRGQGAHAIFAQSVGGGGGEAFAISQLNINPDSDLPAVEPGGAGTISNSTASKLALGGSGGSAGSGGDVRVAVSDSRIFTTGAESFGVFAQSVGGGGGLAGGIESRESGKDAEESSGLIPSAGSLLPKEVNASISGAKQLSKMLGFSLLGDGGNAGDGGRVAVGISDQSEIRLTGDNSVGIFAQSVGGGGGRAGSLLINSSRVGGLSGQLSDLLSFNGSVGGDGVAGDVVVDNRGSIQVTGTGAIGIYAQRSDSAGRTQAGQVLVNTGSVIASGLNGQALRVANSVPVSGSAPIVVNVGQNDIVMGGYRDQNVAREVLGQAASIQIDEGNFRLFNLGLITTMDGLSGDAVVLTGDGSVSIDNHGVIIGNIVQRNASEKQLTEGIRVVQNSADLRRSTTLNNESGGHMAIGKTLDLFNGQLNNRGSLMVDMHNSTLNASFQQDQSGQLQQAVYLGSNNAAVLSVVGTASISGVLAPTWVDRTRAPVPVDTKVPLLYSSGLFTQGLEFRPNSPLMTRFELIRTGDNLDLGIKTSYEIAGLSGNTVASTAGRTIDRLLTQSTFSSEANSLGSALGDIETLEALTAAYEGLVPDEQSLQTQSAINGAVGFRAGLYSCYTPNSVTSYSEQHGCLWVRNSVSDQRERGTGNQAGLSEKAEEYAIGGQYVVNPRAILGSSISQVKLSGQLASNVQRDGYLDQLGLVYKHLDGDRTLSISAGYLEGSFQQSRRLFTGEIAKSDHQLKGFQLGARFQQHILVSGGYLAPFVEAGSTHLKFNEVREQGAIVGNLVIDARRSTLYDFTLGTEVGTEFKVNRFTFRPYGRVSATLLAGDTDATVRARFVSDPAVPFETSSGLDEELFRSAFGIDLFSAGNASLKLEGQMDRGSRTRSSGFQIRYAYPFN